MAKERANCPAPAGTVKDVLPASFVPPASMNWLIVSRIGWSETTKIDAVGSLKVVSMTPVKVAPAASCAVEELLVDSVKYVAAMPTGKGDAMVAPAARLTFTLPLASSWRLPIWPVV